MLLFQRQRTKYKTPSGWMTALQSRSATIVPVPASMRNRRWILLPRRPSHRHLHNQGSSPGASSSLAQPASPRVRDWGSDCYRPPDAVPVPPRKLRLPGVRWRASYRVRSCVLATPDSRPSPSRTISAMRRCCREVSRDARAPRMSRNQSCGVAATASRSLPDRADIRTPATRPLQAS